MTAPDAPPLARREAMEAELEALGERRARALAELREVNRLAAAKVRPARRLKFTQEEIAHLTGTARGTIAEWEKPEADRWTRSRGRRRIPASVDA